MAATAVSLVLTECISINVGGTKVTVPGPVVGAAVVALEAKVREGLKHARQKLATAPGRFRRSECGSGECVSARDVAKALDSVRKELRTSFPPDAAPLLDAVERQLAAEAATLGPPQPMEGIQPVKSGGAQLGYDFASVSGTCNRLVAVIDRFLSINDLALTLNVQSDPKDADFMIEIPSNKNTRRRITTNNNMPNIWRGFYTATVKKRGFKDVVTDVDLINGGPTAVTCTLVPQNAPDDSVCHVR